MLICPSEVCRFTFCRKCRVEWHADATCEQFKQWQVGQGNKMCGCFVDCVKRLRMAKLMLDSMNGEKQTRKLARNARYRGCAGMVASVHFFFLSRLRSRKMEAAIT